ncbi:MAG: 2OG-Fe(II) oxygenase [bacterium]|nr:2OG-Fe(II) oxygenase [bacterium]
MSDQSVRLTHGSLVLASERLVDGHPVYIVDGLFAPDLVRVLHEALRKLEFSLIEYDTVETKNQRDWSHEFSLEALDQTPLLRVWRDTVVAKTNELFPGRSAALARVHCNNQFYGDLQHAHHDLNPGVTALYFANAEWKPDWQGELVFFDRNEEPFHAVAPKPGRVVIFSGHILHRGGVPSRVCFEPRLSVAFKFTADE